ncbi:MAG TPA: class I SAM-dependent methyltransferase [Alphaproteobacteria bacterium]|nr:class I SAM-dependent methyltransferase [Alphaproteobacteria bacterium]
MSASETPSAPHYLANDGAAYERFLGRWSERLAAPFAAFARVPAGDVLDVGCGTGSLAGHLARARRRGAVVGVDVAEPYIAFARKRAGAEAVRFEVGDAAGLSFADGTFAGALAQLVLNFLPDAAAGVREMRRVTRAGGVVAAAVWDFRGGLVFQRLLWDTAAGVDPAAAAHRARLFSHPLAQPDGLVELWRRLGFAAVEGGSLTIRMDFASFADYWEPLLAGQGPVGAYVAGLSPAVRGAIEARVRDAYLAGGEDGRRSMTATAWAVRGIVP